jgi:hypothetical protein
MEIMQLQPQKEGASFYRWATALAMITVFYNIIEGLVSVFLGVEGALFLFSVSVWILLSKLSCSCYYQCGSE